MQVHVVEGGLVKHELEGGLWIETQRGACGTGVAVRHRELSSRLTARSIEAPRIWDPVHGKEDTNLAIRPDGRRAEAVGGHDDRIQPRTGEILVLHPRVTGIPRQARASLGMNLTGKWEK